MDLSRKEQEMSEVIFLPADKARMKGSYRELVQRACPGTGLCHTDILAVKIHPGEEGNTSHVTPEDIIDLLQAFKAGTNRIFLTDTTVLYPGRRRNAADYLRLSREHGFGLPHTPPFMVADGLRGGNEVVVDTPEGFTTEKAHIASLVAEADAMLVVSHFKGHLLTGFGGALKNLGMGCASRAGKLYQHSSVKPSVKEDKCTACGICAAHCHVDAITVSGHASIDHGTCTGCGECLGRCPEGAIRISWNQEMDVFVRRMVEYAWAAVSVSNPILYVNFVTSVVPDCDCMNDTGPAFVNDIGILASTDPVAIDSASLDLVTAAPSAGNSPVKAAAGEDKFRAYRPDVHGELQLSVGEELGLGRSDYRLVRVSV